MHRENFRPSTTPGMVLGSGRGLRCGSWPVGPTNDPRPTTHDPRPTTHDPRPTTHDPRPTTRTGNGHCDLAAGSAVGVCAGGLYRSGAFGEIALPRRRSGEVGFVAGPQDVAQKASHKGPEPSPGGLQVQCLLEMPGRRENAGDAGSGDPACRGTRRLGGAL